MYHTVAMEYENGHDPGTVLMDGIFQRLIELGMVIGQDTVSGDVDAYIHFLEKQEIRTACRNGCLRILCSSHTIWKILLTARHFKNWPGIFGIPVL